MPLCITILLLLYLFIRHCRIIYKTINTGDHLAEISERLKEKLKDLPELPGIYKMLDSKGNIIYIGKSKSLKKRVRTYFTENNTRWSKIKKLVFFIDDLDYEVTDTHLEWMKRPLTETEKLYWNYL